MPQRKRVTVTPQRPEEVQAQLDTLLDRLANARTVADVKAAAEEARAATPSAADRTGGPQGSRG